MEPKSEEIQLQHQYASLVQSHERVPSTRDEVRRQLIEAQLAAAIPSMQKTLMRAEATRAIADVMAKLATKVVEHVLEGDNQKKLDMLQDEKQLAFKAVGAVYHALYSPEDASSPGVSSSSVCTHQNTPNGKEAPLIGECKKHTAPACF